MTMTKPNERAAADTPHEDPMASGGAGWADVFPFPKGSGAPGGTAGLTDALAGAPLKACWIGFSAWARYANATMEALNRYQAGLAAATLSTAPDGASPLQGRALVDETRTLLRRMGEAASLEARRAEFELMKVGEAIAEAAAAEEEGGGPDAPYVRRHEVKP